MAGVPSCGPTSQSTPACVICAMRPPASGATSTVNAPEPMRTSSPGGIGCRAPSIAVASFAIGVHRADASVRVVMQLGYLHRTQVGDAAGEQRVVVVQPPAAAELDDRMVRGPADHRGEDASLVDERAVGMVAHGIAQAMRVGGRVGGGVAALVL